MKQDVRGRTQVHRARATDLEDPHRLEFVVEFGLQALRPGGEA